jgi:crotonobetainyl-CoA:carnitine CoA-transferase CaiB-like acyl-CoA transferase
VTAPLAGVRVLDLTRLLPGPMATLYLADLGADVVKIEDTAAGDYARTLDPSGPQPSACFRALNRGKRSVSLDLRHPDGRAAFFALVRTAHVVIEGFRPGVVAALGVDHAAVAAVNPAIVYCSLTGYGQDGPRAAAAGHDINYLGYAGVLEQTGSAGGAPVLGNVQIADLLGGAATAAIAILATLLPARTRGEGRYLDVAMADGALAHNVFALHALEQHGATAPRGEDLLTGGVPCYGVYATRDGRFLAVGALERKFWQALCDALGRPDLVDGHLARGAAGASVRAALAAELAGATQDEWVERLAGIDCCVTPVLDLAAALDDPQFVARGMVHRHADGRREVAPPVRVAGHAFVAGRPAPAQGEHTAALLREAGFDDATLARWRADGVVRMADPRRDDAGVARRPA